MKAQTNRIKEVEKKSSGSQTQASKEEQIRQVAYELYLKRGGQNGSDLSDWLKAEELVNKRK